MLIRFATALVRLVRAFLCGALIIGVTGVPAAAAEPGDCYPCCSMVQADTLALSCCARQEGFHGSATTRDHDHPPSQQVPVAACDTLTCLGSMLGFSCSAAITSTSAAIPVPVTFPDFLPGAVAFEPPPGLIADFHHRVSAPPIHLRTCVYLI